MSLVVKKIKFDKSKLENISKADAARATKLGAELVLQHSKKYVPHDKGMLENSGSVDFNSSKPEATAFYDTPYAVRLHEHPDYNFRKGRQGKWLEKAAKEKQKDVLKLMADVMKGAFK